MPQTITLPLHIFKLHLSDGENLVMLLTDPHAVFFKKKAESLAEKYREQFQKSLLDQGRYANILDEVEDGNFENSTVQIDFPASKDGLTYPAFQLEYQYFFKKTPSLCWGIIPALALEAVSEQEEGLPDRLREAIKVEFTSRKRLSFVQHILSALWYEHISLEKSDIELTFHSPSELPNVKKEEKRNLLAKVATKLEVTAKTAYGREDELRQLERILASNFSKNILLTGASGTGKTALVWELAHRRQQQKVNNHIWETTASILIKELTVETGWQDNLSMLVKELTKNGDFLFVRNLAELFEVGQYQGNEVSMAEYLRPYISRGELTLVSECTPEEKARIEVRSPNYLAFFQEIRLEEPKTDLEGIIQKKVADIAGVKKVVFEDDAVDEVIRLHRRFSPYSGLPGKPIRFLESVLLGLTPDMQEPETKGKKKKKKQPKTEKQLEKVVVGKQAVLQHYCDESGMPLFMIDPALPMDVAEIKTQFKNQVFGQNLAVDTVVDLLASVKTALTRTGKPIASFLFVGPTGVGKTELAKVLAQFMFSSKDRMLRFDMSEYSDPFSVMRLLGQGYYTDGLLTAAVRREPFCVLLFDEIEKADATFYDLLLQILGEGRLSDSQGKLVNFCSAIIIMTSNIGATKWQGGQIGWKNDQSGQGVSAHFLSEVEKNFKPELYNRIDSIVAFEPLAPDTVRAVVEREISLLKKREGIQFRRLDFTLDTSVLDFLATKGYDPRYGARYLQRTIREKLVVPLAYTLNRFDYDDQLIVKASMQNGDIVLHTSSDPLAFDLLMEQWDKLTLSEQASNLRRKMLMCMEGPILTRMNSEIDMMESEKNYDEKRFWQNLEQSNLYSNLLNAREKADLLNKRINQYEIEIALASMEQGSFDPAFEERLSAWEKDFSSFLAQVYGYLFPDYNYCYLNIFGSGFEPVLQFYMRLAKHRGFSVHVAQLIWYREGFDGVDDDHPYIQPQLKPSGPYIKRTVSEDELLDFQPLPPDPTDKLFGVEICFAGQLPFVYFSQENGLQQWELTSKEALHLFKITAGIHYSPTPPGIYRQQFYQKPKPRRSILQQELSDQSLNLQAQVRMREAAVFFAEALDEIFERELEKMFL